DAVGGNVAGEEPHDVVHRQRVVHDAAGAVDVEVDVLVALDALEVEHLHDDAGGRDVVDLADEEHHAVLEEHFLEGHLAVAAVAAGPAGAGHADRPGGGGGMGKLVGGRWDRGAVERAAADVLGGAGDEPGVGVPEVK